MAQSDIENNDAIFENSENRAKLNSNSASMFSALDADIFRAMPDAGEQNVFAKGKALMAASLERAFPLYLRLRDNSELMAYAVKHALLKSRKRKPNAKNAAVLAVMIATDPQDVDQTRMCYDPAYALRALADWGVAPAEFLERYNSSTQAEWKKHVREKRKLERLAVTTGCPAGTQITKRQPELKLNVTSPRPFFATVFVDFTGLTSLCAEYAVEDGNGPKPTGTLSDEDFQARYSAFLRSAKILATPALSLIEQTVPDDTVADGSPQEGVGAEVVCPTSPQHDK